jgi:hypothetical protein
MNAKLPLSPPAVARTNSTPPGWGTDELSKFLQETQQQQYATFHNKREETSKLIQIDALFVRASANWLNPKSEIEAMLLLRCHAALRAAAGEAMAIPATSRSAGPNRMPRASMPFPRSNPTATLRTCQQAFAGNLPISTRRPIRRSSGLPKTPVRRPMRLAVPFRPNNAALPCAQRFRTLKTRQEPMKRTYGERWIPRAVWRSAWDRCRRPPIRFTAI